MDKMAKKSGFDMSLLSDDIKGIIAENLRFSQKEPIKMTQYLYFNPSLKTVDNFEFEDGLGRRFIGDNIDDWRERALYWFDRTEKFVRKEDLQQREFLIWMDTGALKELQDELRTIDQESTDSTVKHKKYKLWLDIIARDEELENETIKYNYMKTCYIMRNFVLNHSSA